MSQSAIDWMGQIIADRYKNPATDPRHLLLIGKPIVGHATIAGTLQSAIDRVFASGLLDSFNRLSKLSHRFGT